MPVSFYLASKFCGLAMRGRCRNFKKEGIDEATVADFETDSRFWTYPKVPRRIKPLRICTARTPTVVHPTGRGSSQTLQKTQSKC